MEKTVYINSVISNREDTLAAWEQENPVLERGEAAIIRDGDDGRWLKIGDGTTPFKNLPYKMGPQGPKGEKGEKGDSGSGKAAEPLKLIKTIKLTEDVTDINVTFDKGLKEIALFMDVAFDTEATNKTLAARSDSGLWYMFCEILQLKNTKQFFYVHGKETAERLWETINHDTLISSVQGIGASVTNNRLVTSRRANNLSRYVKNLNIFVINREQKIATGSTIEIWGVEADENI